VTSSFTIHDARLEMNYEIETNGILKIGIALKKGIDELPELPRFGIRMGIKRTLAHMKYYGCGPHENYIDRRHAAHLGVYETTAGELYHPYIRPQANGNRVACRWLTLLNTKAEGVRITGNNFFAFSALPFDDSDLDFDPESSQRKHTIDIQEKDYVQLNLDYSQQGVGGDDSWGSHTHEKYKLHYQNYDFEFRLELL